MPESKARNRRRAASGKRDKGKAAPSHQRAEKRSASKQSSNSRSDSSRSAQRSRSTSRATASRKAQGDSSGGRTRTSQRRTAGAASRNGIGPFDVVQRTREQLAAMLGRPVETVLGVDSDAGNWIVTAQIVELARIPNTTDVLGEYEVMLNKKGEVLRFKRTRRLHRGATDGGDSS